jgi:hypothetical protein
VDGSIEWAQAVVEFVVNERPGVRILDCRLVGGRSVRALAYTELFGRLAPGQSVWLNLRALDLGLGTGGVAFVAAPGVVAGGTAEIDPAASGEKLGGVVAGGTAENDPAASGEKLVGVVAANRPAEDSGYLVKARYTPLQVVTRGVDSPRSPHHGVLARAESLDGLPVVVADLHSSLPAICAAILYDAARASQSPRLVYVMTDGAALPIAYSRTVARLKRDGSLMATITAGQAYGGDYEAVSLHSALLAAKHVAQADVVICIQGPGNLGSDTTWGFSGVAVGEAVNAAAILGGRPVGCLRVSGADWRERHRGLSHHSVTAYGRVALRPAELAVPRLTGELASVGVAVEAAARPLAERHRLVSVEVGDLAPILAATAGLNTMGRDYGADPAAFLAAAAAGRLAWRMVSEQSG